MAFDADHGFVLGTNLRRQDGASFRDTHQTGASFSACLVAVS